MVRIKLEQLQSQMPELIEMYGSDRDADVEIVTRVGPLIQHSTPVAAPATKPPESRGFDEVGSRPSAELLDEAEQVCKQLGYKAPAKEVQRVLAMHPSVKTVEEFIAARFQAAGRSAR